MICSFWFMNIISSCQFSNTTHQVYLRFHTSFSPLHVAPESSLWDDPVHQTPSLPLCSSKIISARLIAFTEPITDDPRNFGLAISLGAVTFYAGNLHRSLYVSLSSAHANNYLHLQAAKPQVELQDDLSDFNLNSYL